MTAKALQQLIERIPSWPDEAQTQALAYLEFIERELHDLHVLTDEDKASIDRGLKDAREGRFASEAEVEALLAQYWTQ